MVEIIYRRNELHCTVKVTIFNVWFQPILRSFGQLSLRKERERDQPRMLKNHLSFIEPRNYSTENMDHIMDGKCAVSDSQALSFYPVEHLYKDSYNTFEFFVLLQNSVTESQYLQDKSSDKHNIQLHIKLYMKVQLGRKTRLHCVSVRRTIMDVRDS